MLEGGYWGMEGLAWSRGREGASVFFSATLNGSDYVVHEFDLDGHELPTRQNIGMMTIHDVAADGTWLVSRDDTPVRLSFRSPGSTDDRDLSWLDNGLAPVLSGDGKMLAFTDQSLGAGPYYAVTIRPTSGGAVVRLGEGSGLQFSADGKSVLAYVYSSPPRLMSYPVGVGQPTRLDHGEFENISNASWMPDGHRILVDGNEPGKPPRSFVLDSSSGSMEPVGRGRDPQQSVGARRSRVRRANAVGMVDLSDAGSRRRTPDPVYDIG